MDKNVLQKIRIKHFLKVDFFLGGWGVNLIYD